MQSRHRTMIGALVTVLLLATLMVGLLPSRSAGPMYTRQERLGIAFVRRVAAPGGGFVTQSLSQYHVAPLGVGWYSDWWYRAEPDQPADTILEYVQLISVSDGSWPPNWTALENAVSANPGSTWLIGNEPECPNQDSVTPEVYAGRYHQAYTQIKGWDATAQIAIGAIVQPTPLRFRWLERAMAAYETNYGQRMPVDVWNIHIQILPEGSPDGQNPQAGAGIPVGVDPVAEGLIPRQYGPVDNADPEILKSMVLDFREWMAAQGERDKPLIISEMGVLYPSIYLVAGGTEEERQRRGDRAIELFMAEAFKWLYHTTDAQIGYPADENRLVQRWLWFSLNDSFYDEDLNPRGFNGSLYNYETQQLTRFGIWFMSLQHEHRVFLPLVRIR
jgi:hypothetical protein